MVERPTSVVAGAATGPVLVSAVVTQPLLRHIPIPKLPGVRLPHTTPPQSQSRAISELLSGVESRRLFESGAATHVIARRGGLPSRSGCPLYNEHNLLS